MKTKLHPLTGLTDNRQQMNTSRTESKLLVVGVVDGVAPWIAEELLLDWGQPGDTQQMMEQHVYVFNSPTLYNLEI